MKKIFLFLFTILTVTTYAQRHRASGNGEIKWLSLAVKGGFGGTMLFNNDVSSDDNVSQDFLSPSYEFGGRFGITYGDYIGLGVEVLSAGFSQDYSISDGIVVPYTKKQKFTTMDFVVALRYTSPYGFYFEAGPKFSTLKTASVENSVEANFTDELVNDYMTNFTEKHTSIIAGLGYALYNGDRFQVNLGLRGSYGLGNMQENENYYVLNDGVYMPQGSFSAKTSPFTLKATLELNYTFGFWGDASCGRGRLMFFQ